LASPVAALTDAHHLMAETSLVHVKPTATGEAAAATADQPLKLTHEHNRPFAQNSLFVQDSSSLARYFGRTASCRPPNAPITAALRAVDRLGLAKPQPTAANGITVPAKARSGCAPSAHVDPSPRPVSNLEGRLTGDLYDTTSPAQSHTATLASPSRAGLNLSNVIQRTGQELLVAAVPPRHPPHAPSLAGLGRARESPGQLSLPPPEEISFLPPTRLQPPPTRIRPAAVTPPPTPPSLSRGKDASASGSHHLWI